MKKVISKRKITICLDETATKTLEGFENKSKYIEYLIYKDLKECGLLKKDMIL
jgi:tRNA splicing endonuclease